MVNLHFPSYYFVDFVTIDLIKVYNVSIRPDFIKKVQLMKVYSQSHFVYKVAFEEFMMNDRFCQIRKINNK